MSVSKSTAEALSKKSLKSQRVEDKFLVLRVVKLEAEMTCKTFETVNLLKLGGIDFHQYHKNKILPFVTTKGLEDDYYLFIVEYVNVSLHEKKVTVETFFIIQVFFSHYYKFIFVIS